MQTITITLDEPLGQFIAHASRSRNVSPQKTALEWMMLGFRAFLTEQYQRYRRGEMSFGRMAAELGVTTWELSHLLEEQGWLASNLPSKDVAGVSEGDATYNINESPPVQQE